MLWWPRFPRGAHAGTHKSLWRGCEEPGSQGNLCPSEVPSISGGWLRHGKWSPYILRAAALAFIASDKGDLQHWFFTWVFTPFVQLVEKWPELDRNSGEWVSEEDSAAQELSKGEIILISHIYRVIVLLSFLFKVLTERAGLPVKTMLLIDQALKKRLINDELCQKYLETYTWDAN